MYEAAFMNLDYCLQRVLGRATCELAQGAKLHRRARIRNARGDSARIKVGRRSYIQGELLLFGHGGQIELGEWCFVGEGSRIWSACRISIGDRVLISHNVNIFDNITHPFSAEKRHQHYRSIIESGHPKDVSLDEQEVTIASDALIGANVVILRGVRIGEGAIVGAGSVVTHHVPPWSIVAGNPAKTIRELDESER